MKYGVYTWKDPRTGEVIYVGKGTKARSRETSKGDRGSSPLLWRWLVQAKREGVEPQVRWTGCSSEERAFSEEIRLISLYGRADLGRGTLLNCTDGGEGSSWSPAQKERGSRTQRQRLEDDPIRRAFCKFLRRRPGSDAEMYKDFYAWLPSLALKVARDLSDDGLPSPRVRRAVQEAIGRIFAASFALGGGSTAIKKRFVSRLGEIGDAYSQEMDIASVRRGGVDAYPHDRGGAPKPSRYEVGGAAWRNADLRDEE